MEKNCLKECRYIHIYVYVLPNHFALYLKPTLYFKSTVLQLKKNFFKVRKYLKQIHTSGKYARGT